MTIFSPIGLIITTLLVSSLQVDCQVRRYWYRNGNGYYGPQGGMRGPVNMAPQPVVIVISAPVTAAAATTAATTKAPVG